MAKPDDVPQDAWDTGVTMAQEYVSWLDHGNSVGHLSEHAVEAMADTIARAIMAAKAEEREVCARLAEDCRIEPEVDHVGLVDGANRACVKIASAIRKRVGA